MSKSLEIIQYLRNPTKLDLDTLNKLYLSKDEAAKGYLSTSGGYINGNLDITGDLKINGNGNLLAIKGTYSANKYNSDFNNPGIYYLTHIPTIPTTSNFPLSGNGGLLIVTPADDTNETYNKFSQVIFDFNNSDHYFRYIKVAKDSNELLFTTLWTDKNNKTKLQMIRVHSNDEPQYNKFRNPTFESYYNYSTDAVTANTSAFVCDGWFRSGFNDLRQSVYINYYANHTITWKSPNPDNLIYLDIYSDSIKRYSKLSSPAYVSLDRGINTFKFYNNTATTTPVTPTSLSLIVGKADPKLTPEDLAINYAVSNQKEIASHFYRKVKILVSSNASCAYMNRNIINDIAPNYKYNYTYTANSDDKASTSNFNIIENTTVNYYNSLVTMYDTKTIEIYQSKVSTVDSDGTFTITEQIPEVSDASFWGGANNDTNIIAGNIDIPIK